MLIYAVCSYVLLCRAVLCLLLCAATGESCYVLAVLPTSAVHLMLRDMPDHAMLCGHMLLCAVLVAVRSYWRELSSELQLRQGGALSIAEILNRMRDGAQLKLQATERELCLTLNALAGQLTAAADEAEAAAAADEQQQQQGGTGGGSSSSSKKGRKRGRRSKAAAAAAAAGEPAAASDGDESEDDTAWVPGSSDRAAAAARGGGGSSSHQRPKKRVRLAAAAAVAGDEDEDAAAAEETGEAVAAAAAAAAASGAGGSSGSSSSKRVSAAAGGADAESPDELRRAALQLLEDSYKVREWLHACAYAQQTVCAMNMRSNVLRHPALLFSSHSNGMCEWLHMCHCVIAGGINASRSWWCGC
jgi:hypothetical protein